MPTVSAGRTCSIHHASALITSTGSRHGSLSGRQWARNIALPYQTVMDGQISRLGSARLDLARVCSLGCDCVSS